MASKFGVSIEPIGKSDFEYSIKDYLKLNIGKINVINLDRENKSCSLRLKFFKSEKKELLRDSLINIASYFFEKEKFYKINLYVSEDMPINSLLLVGFELEGVLSDSLIVSGAHKSELIFGLNMYDYRIKNRKPSVIELKGSNIEVKNLTPDNAQEMLDYYIRNFNHLKEFEPQKDRSFYTYEVQYSILMESYKQLIDGTGIDLGIFKDKKIIGKIRISNIVYGVFRNAFIGYSIDENEQGKGYMKEAVKLVLKYAFSELELHRIEATAMVENTKSQRVLRSCGFKELGISEKYLFINGEWKDHVVFYNVNSEYSC
ncbi:GNAT family N-acetyltransferase [Clostridium intestinale]|uniref:Ribosomal-protein-alanine N-acetyltransferase n=1 Tax=Clostridium intestinale DSM 6191 TaxID=1121320 RepID=A0A1M6EMW0_9CLOT|nr:GNAT family protein [Clostridium intestinale]WRY50822.1 GNAT family protein [Clostridium intestinale]SHI86895.1 ribosomal-protein-alanine N-acetyltransferase [Clostridium intestinale DSM 6191]